MTKTIRINEKPIKQPIQRFDWPRMADDGETQLGVDVEEKREDIIRIVYKYFKVKTITMEELLQEVFLAILHKNHSRSAHDPRKSSFGHYVYMVANNVCINLAHKAKRYGRESDSLDAPCYNNEDNRPLIETIESDTPEPTYFEETSDDIETSLRHSGRWDLARYIRATRSGAKPAIIREALSFGGKKVTTKLIREYREDLKEFVSSYQDLTV